MGVHGKLKSQLYPYRVPRTMHSTSTVRYRCIQLHCGIDFKMPQKISAANYDYTAMTRIYVLQKIPESLETEKMAVLILYWYILTLQYHYWYHKFLLISFILATDSVSTKLTIVAAVAIIMYENIEHESKHST